MDQNMQSPPYPENGGRGKAWKIAALVVLLLCALPVLIPVSLCVAGGVLVVALCVAGAALAAVMCVAGGVFGLGVCVLAGLMCLAALQIAALAGVGFGAVLLFQALCQILVNRRFADAELLGGTADGGAGLDDIFPQRQCALLRDSLHRRPPPHLTDPVPSRSAKAAVPHRGPGRPPRSGYSFILYGFPLFWSGNNLCGGWPAL